MRNAPRSRRGLTLIEVMIATTISLILTAAAVLFATQETRLLDISQERLEVSMAGRAAISLLADDIRKAGAGVGYDEQGRFMGLRADRFTMGGLAWNMDGTAIPPASTAPYPLGVSRDINLSRSVGSDYTVATHDLGIMYADGNYATIVRERAYIGTLCGVSGQTFENNEQVLLRDASGISGISGTIQTSPLGAGAACPCQSGCATFSFTPSTMMMSGTGATRVTYGFGEVQGGLKGVVWFVEPNARGEGELRRAVFDDATTTCTTRGSCGGLVADYAETLLTQVYVWDDTANRWQNAGQAPTSETTERMRVDLELIIRSENATRSQRPEVETRLRANSCVPGPCGTPDNYARVAFRTSVEVLNSGHMRMR